MGPLGREGTLFRAPEGREPISVDAALGIVLDSVPSMGAEKVPLSEALGRTLWEEIRAGFDLPPFANSAMDGYAVRSGDTQGCSREQPRRLLLVEDVPAGSVPARRLQPGEATRVMTGAPIPEGADAVVKVEETEPEPGHVVVFSAVGSGANVRPSGEDVSKGEVAIESGSLIRAAEVGMLAALGNKEVAVGRRPRVAVITTGQELVFPGERLLPGQIYDSNGFSLSTQVCEAGGEVVFRFHCIDEVEALERDLQASSEAHVVVASGAVSAGLYDVVRGFMLKRGEVHFYRVGMRPGMPVLFGSYAGKPFFGLPGNPVSSMVVFEVLVRPALLRMQGRSALHRPRVSSVSEQAIRSRAGIREYLRARTDFREDGYHSRLVGPQGSGRLSTMVQANSLLVVPEDVLAIEAGQTVSVILTEARETG